MKLSRLTAALALCALVPAHAAAQSCTGSDRSITVPEGFCVTVFADEVGSARHLAVTSSSVVFVALSGRNGGGLILRDTDGDGFADESSRFAEGPGSDVEIRGDWIYYSTYGEIFRYRWDAQLQNLVGRETIVSDLPDEGGHFWGKSLAFDDAGFLYVNIGSATNSCQVADRQERSPGQDPCLERDTRAGIWRFRADRIGQTFQDGTRFATGLRNTIALAMGPDGRLYGAVHGRDQLLQNWGNLFDAQYSAENPAEEFVRIEQGDDFGWPYCYYDPDRRAKVLSPEYGGDGNEVGLCAAKKDPLIGFPGHWAPNSILFYSGDQFPPSYRGGAFVAFHGSWNRAPLPQQGYNVVFVPFDDGEPTGEWNVFAEGFRTPGQGRRSAHRPVGLAQMPDGSILLTDDSGGRIYRITYAR
ncbi:MAG: PQQ-dependent sugar dehydrogenase [Gemmatimonadales bacterium]